MRKKIIFALLVVVAFSLNAWAEQISPEAAAEIAASFVNERPMLRKAHQAPQTASSLRLAHTRQKAASSENAFYVFNRADNAGFIIVSADDRTAEDVLGYSDGGADFNMETINPNLRFWLDRYQEEISAIDDDPQAALQPRKAKQVSAIAPLLKNQNGVEITWYQETPYNNYCPIDQRDNTRSLTGCVATATAAIMYKWQYPAKGTGTHSYTWKDCKDNKCNQYWSITMTSNFDTVTFDWANMLPAYEGVSATATQKKAVASLMYNVGIAADMQYGGDANGGSGAWTDDMGYGLVTYFGYELDKFISMYSKSSYQSAKGTSVANITAEYSVTRSQFTTYFNADLEAGHPILMGGEDPDNGGHEFVCDGRDSNNKFHINWGWEGSGNGYFEISALKPGSYNFSSNLDAIIGLRPAVQAEDVNVEWYADGELFDQTVASHGVLSLPTNTPEDCVNGKVFVGWTADETYEGDEAPTFVKAGEFLEADATYYAVYATAQEGEGGGGFEKASSIAVGDKVVLVYETDSQELSGIAGSSTKYGDAVAYTSEPAGAYLLDVVAGSESGTFALKHDDVYLQWTSSNSLNTKSSVDANSSWNISFVDGDAIITNASDEERSLQWNSSSPRFACYTSSQQPVQLYKQGAGVSYSAFTTSCSGEAPEPEYFTIRFFDNGQQVGEDQSVLKNQSAVAPEITPACEDYTFVGWWTAALDADNTEAKAWVTTFKATKDQDYYAIYSKTETSGGSSQPVEESLAFVGLGKDNQTDVNNEEIIIGNHSTIMFAKGSGSVTPKYYTTGTAIRAYGGNTVTVAADANMSLIEFTFDSGEGSNAISANTGTYDDGTWTGDAATVVFTIEGTSGHRRFKTVTVTIGTAAGYTTYYSSVLSCTQTDIENVIRQEAAVKAIRNGQIVIIRGGAVYTITGTRVE